jgi:hypothetical protein
MWFIAAVFAAQISAPPAFDVSSLSVAAPTLVCELDLNQLKGELRRLSWSPDGRSIHLQTAAPDAPPRDYIVTVMDGVVSQAFGEPEWAAEYWAMKSNLAAPGVPSLRTGRKKYRLMTAAVGRANL